MEARASGRQRPTVDRAARKEKSQNERWGAPAAALERALAKSRRGERLLAIYGCAPEAGVGDDGAAKLAAAIAEQEVLVSLQFRHHRVGDCGAAALAAALSRHAPRLRRLDLGDNAVGDAGAARLAEALAAPPRAIGAGPGAGLRLLSLQGNRLGDAGAESVCRLLGASPELEEVQLGDNAIRSAGVAALARGAARHRSLRTLVLDRNAVGPDGAEALASMLTPEGAAPSEGSRPPRRPPKASPASGAERTPPMSRKGSSAAVEAGYPDAAASLPVAPEAPPAPADTDREPVGWRAPGAGLHALHLCGCSLGDLGASTLASAIRWCPELKELHLSSNDVGDEGASALSGSMESHAGLRSLALDGNRVSDAAALTLVAALSRMERQDLICNLRGNPITRFDAASLANLTVAAGTARDMSRRGVTVRLLLKLWLDFAASRDLDIETASTREVVRKLVKPYLANKRTSFSGFFHAPRPTVHVVHAWDAKFRDLVVAVTAHATGIPAPSLDSSHVMFREVQSAFDRCYFVDAFCVDQNVPAPIGDQYCQTDKFDLVIDLLRRAGGEVMLVMDREFLPITRLWCLYEAHHAVRGGMRLEVSFGEMRPFPRKRRGAKVGQAQISSEADRALISGDVTGGGGGFDSFDKLVTRPLEEQMKAKYLETFPKVKELQPELEWLEAQDNAREDLIAAVRAKDLQELGLCIGVADEVRLEKEVLQPAKFEHARLQLEASARRCDAALEPGSGAFADEYGTNTAAMAEDPPAPPPRRPMVTISRKRFARERLEELMPTEDIEAMREALDVCVREGVEEGVQDVGRKRLATLELAAALDAEDAGAVHRAIAAGRKVGLEASLLSDAVQRYAALAEYRIDLSTVDLSHVDNFPPPPPGDEPQATEDDEDPPDEWWLGLREEKSGQALLILEIREGAIKVWNDENPGCEVEPGDFLLGINNASESAVRLRDEIRKDPKRMKLRLRRKAFAELLLEDLRPSLESEDRDEVKAAVEAAQRAHISGEVVAAAKARLELLDRRAGLRRMLASAVESATAKMLQGVIDKVVEADVGIEAEALEAAHRRVALLRARAAAEDGAAQALHVALAEARAAGLGCDDLEAAEARLRELDAELYRASAAEALAEAAERGVAAELARRLAQARVAKVNAEAIDTAAWELSRVRRRFGYRALQAAIAATTAAVDKARFDGYDGEALGLAEARLAAAQHELDKRMAREDLLGAMRGDSIDAMWPVIDAATERGVDASVLREARVKVTALEMAGAMEGDDAEALQEAIEKAKREGVAVELIDAAKRRLREVDEDTHRELIAAELRAAVQAGDDPALAKSIEEAAAVGVDADVVADARRRLAQVRIAAATDARDEEALRGAIAEAEAVDVAEDEVARAKRNLAEIRMTSLASSGADLDALRVAIEQAEIIGVEDALVADARRRLADHALRAAMEGVDVAALRGAIDDAEAVGVDPEVIEMARVHTAKTAALQEVAEAMLGEDSSRLQRALAAAEEAGVDAESLASAKDRFIRLELILAIRADSAALLRRNIDIATKAGVEEELMAKARFRLIEINLADSTSAATDPRGLVAALTAAKEAGVARPAIEAAKKKLKGLDPASHTRIVEDELREASEGSEVDWIRELLKQAQAAEADEEYILAGKVRVAHILLDALDEAEEDIPKLRDALRAADAASLGEDPAQAERIEALRERLRELEVVHKRQVAKMRLIAALQDGNDIGELRAAMEAAAANGVEELLIKQAKSLLE